MEKFLTHIRNNHLDTFSTLFIFWRGLRKMTIKILYLKPPILGPAPSRVGLLSWSARQELARGFSLFGGGGVAESSFHVLFVP